MAFELINAFKNKDFIVDLNLCRVLMEDKVFPWILLIPRVSNITQMNQLKESDSIQLIKEINFATNIMENIFPTDRINVAAIGNKSPQLHIHIISRTKNDPLWPETIWGQEMEILDNKEKEKRIYLLKKAFENSDLMLN